MRRSTRFVGLVTLGALGVFGALGACGGGEAGPDLAVEAAGPFPVGHATLQVTDAARMRPLVVEVWYPAAESARAAAEAGEPIQGYGVDPAQIDAYAMLLGTAPSGCPTTTSHAARDAEVAAVPAGSSGFPLVAFSHCHNCVRFSSVGVAERLASHGFVVVAPDHTGNTLHDQLAGTAVELSSEFLVVRAADVRFALDLVLGGDGDASLPAGLRAATDSSRIGVFGHSFGAVTAGLVLETDPRVTAGLALAAPMENPLLAGVTLANIMKPTMFIVAVEDNSITELGNNFMRMNFDDAPAESWKLEIADAGHWGVSDISALVPDFAPGCGDGERQTDGMPFTYLAPSAGRAIVAAHVTAFFLTTLADSAGARAYLTAARPSGVTADHHD